MASPTSREVFPLLQVSGGVCVGNIISSFHISEAIWAWSFVGGKAFNHKFNLLDGYMVIKVHISV